LIVPVSDTRAVEPRFAGEIMDAPAKFTLRFHDPRNHELLGLVASRFGVSKNQLAEEMLERELRAASLLLERDLTGTLELLRSYRAADRVQADIEAAAHAEAYEHDPLTSHRAQTASGADAYDIGAMFAS
jgi:hypothetical protein